MLEALFEYVLGSIVGFLWRAIMEVGERSEVRNPPLAGFGYLLLGALAGALTLAVFPHRFFHPSGVRGLSLMVSPVITGALMSWTGSILRRRNKQPAPIESFSYGFAFALGVALIRFLWAR